MYIHTFILNYKHFVTYIATYMYQLYLLCTNDFKFCAYNLTTKHQYSSWVSIFIPYKVVSTLYSTALFKVDCIHVRQLLDSTHFWKHLWHMHVGCVCMKDRRHENVHQVHACTYETLVHCCVHYSLHKECVYL